MRKPFVHRSNSGICNADRRRRSTTVAGRESIPNAFNLHSFRAIRLSAPSDL